MLESYESAKALVQTAQLNLGFTKVTSLVDGVAAIATGQIGDLVGPGTLLTTVSQISPIKAYFPVSEQEYLRMPGFLNRADSSMQPWGSNPEHEPIHSDGNRHAKKEPVHGGEGLWEASQLLYCSLLRSASQTSATLDHTAEAVVSTAADFKGFTRADFMRADGTGASLACPIVSVERTAATGSMAGVADAMAGGGCRVGMDFLSISVMGLLP